MQKQGREYSPETKEDEYKKQYHPRSRILIVDDEPVITSSFKEALRDNGFEQVETANDPLLALKTFNAGSYDFANYRHCNVTNGWIQPIRRN